MVEGLHYGRISTTESASGNPARPVHNASRMSLNELQAFGLGLCRKQHV